MEEEGEKPLEKTTLFEEGVRTLCHAIREDPLDQIRFQSCLSLARVVQHLPHQPKWNERNSKNEEREKEEEDSESESESENDEDEEEIEKDKEMCLEELVVWTLMNAMRDENRYVRGYAREALTRLAPFSPDADAALMLILRTSAWCSLTTELRPY